MCLVLVAVTGVLGAQDAINKDIINKKIERKLDVSSQLVKVTNKITLENGGSAAVKSFLFVLTQAEKERISYLNVQVRNIYGEWLCIIHWFIFICVLLMVKVH